MNSIITATVKIIFGILAVTIAFDSYAESHYELLMQMLQLEHTADDFTLSKLESWISGTFRREDDFFPAFQQPETWLLVSWVAEEVNQRGFRYAGLKSAGQIDTVVPTPALPQGYIVQGGLTWTPNNLIVPDAYITWDAAKNYCATGTFNGQKGWRLPTLGELYQSGALNGHGWALHRTWSATRNGDDVHWLIILGNGNMYDYRNSYRSSVTCVH